MKKMKHLKKMKKITILALVATILVLLSSCSYSLKGISQELSYSDPQTIGGKWTVSFDNGDTYHGAVCSYWGTTDDTSVWKLSDGTVMIQSGTCHAVQEM